MRGPALEAAPLVPVAAAFIRGLILAVSFQPHPVALWLGASLSALATAGWLLRGRSAAAAAGLLLTVALIGLLRAAAPILPADHIARLALPSPLRVEGRLASEPIRWAPDRTRLLLETEGIQVGKDRRSVRGLVQVALYGEPPPLTEGQRIAGELRLHRPFGFRNPRGFDYPGHLAREGIFLVGSGRGDRLEALTPEAPPWPVRIKRWAVTTIQRHLPPASAALLAGLLLGERTEFPPAADEAFRRAGVYHILAVSGFNVALLASAVFLGLSLLRLPRRLVAAAAIGLLIGFALVVGGEPSVVRATVMGVLLLLGLLLERETSLFNSVALAALVILLWRPGDLWEPGFQLSFAATLGILYLARPWIAALTERGWPQWLAASVAVSLGAQLAVLPIMLIHFNQLSLIGIVANLVVVPLAAVATTLGLAALLLTLLHEGLGHLLFQSLWLVLLALRAAVWILAALPAAMIYLPGPHSAAVVAFYAVLAALPHWGLHRAMRYGAVGLTALVLAASLWPWVRPADGRLRVTFLDVGQGDAAFVELPDGRRLLVDGGPGGERRFDVGERVVAPFLWNRAVWSLDAAVMTHADPDHAGGLAAILRRFRVRELWDNGIADAGELSRLAERRGTLRRRLHAGDRIWLGAVPFTVLHPPATPLAGSPRGPAADENNNSLVLRLDWGLASVLLTGDVEQEGEADLLARRRPLDHRVLKVAHHGSRYSTTEEFLATGRPALAVISAGRRNPFNHPTPEVVERLAKAGVKIYRTDRDGAVVVETDGAALSVTRWASRATDALPLASHP
ncbi:MAG: DNA internalization-related competence protein ComEC/Rec2 [Candidatus Rokubacteria bacterium]|nr:DNA internalization-related competence protein ComEC/Rec2 [Candidatus Rokubacteria bacterium]